MPWHPNNPLPHPSKWVAAQREGEEVVFFLTQGGPESVSEIRVKQKEDRDYDQPTPPQHPSIEPLGGGAGEDPNQPPPPLLTTRDENHARSHLILGQIPHQRLN